jgi:TRAP-type mannitol/chloroaromatic compound transport system permease large subunit
MSYELIAILIFTSMLLMLLTGQRVFAAIGGVATLFALMLWGKGSYEMPFNASFVLLNWYPLLTLPLFIYMGYMFSESGIASDLYRMFHVWTGPVQWRIGHRHHRPDGRHIGHERIERRRYGNWRQHRLAGNAQTQV